MEYSVVAELREMRSPEALFHHSRGVLETQGSWRDRGGTRDYRHHLSWVGSGLAVGRMHLTRGS